RIQLVLKIDDRLAWAVVTRLQGVITVYIASYLQMEKKNELYLFG
ncbi:MAG: hypothetical protein K0R23_3314, partial [Lacrimispora sp.]|nr:hypothetical protein [Lacrimispora sp.]